MRPYALPPAVNVHTSSYSTFTSFADFPRALPSFEHMLLLLRLCLLGSSIYLNTRTYSSHILLNLFLKNKTCLFSHYPSVRFLHGDNTGRNKNYILLNFIYQCFHRSVSVCKKLNKRDAATSPPRHPQDAHQVPLSSNI